VGPIKGDIVVAQSTSTATGTTTSTWTIDASHSLAEFSVKHMMVSNVKGRFGELSGTIQLDEADITKSSVDVSINVASIDTRDEKRDAHLKSPDFFDVENFPVITFKSTKVDQNGRDRLNVTGDLTIHGTTRPVILETELNGRSPSPWGTEVIAFSAQTTISRKDWDMNFNIPLESGGVVVGDKVKVSIEVEAIKQ
jgi:polyisoprenoid-binding protein YceI